jgi:quercetin dioxygenase-like cupin family protein
MSSAVHENDPEAPSTAPRKSFYERWKDSEGIPTVRGYFINDLSEIQLTPWSSRGGSGVFVNLEGTGGLNDAYVCEIAPRATLAPIKHMYDEMIFVVHGRGATEVWLDGGPKQVFEWSERAFFAMPPNAWHRHFNLASEQLVRYFAVTSAPVVMDTFKSLDFVFNNPYVFKDRFDGEEGYFNQTARGSSRRWKTNFVADVLASSERLSDSGEERGAGARNVRFDLVNGTARSHTSAWPVGTYKKAHRHGPGIHVIILRGHGYSLLWRDGYPMEHIEWGPGSILVPPEMWFHQHFNTGSEPVLFLAIGSGRERPKASGESYVYTSTREGGDQIEYEDEDPEIHAGFEAALAVAGVRCEMGSEHPFCTAR